MKRSPVNVALNVELRNGGIAQCHRARQRAPHARELLKVSRRRGFRYHWRPRFDAALYINQLHASARTCAGNLLQFKRMLSGETPRDRSTPDTSRPAVVIRVWLGRRRYCLRRNRRNRRIGRIGRIGRIIFQPRNAISDACFLIRLQ